MNRHAENTRKPWIASAWIEMHKLQFNHSINFNQSFSVTLWSITTNFSTAAVKESASRHQINNLHRRFRKKFIIDSHAQVNRSESGNKNENRQKQTTNSFVSKLLETNAPVRSLAAERYDEITNPNWAMFSDSISLFTQSARLKTSEQSNEVLIKSLLIGNGFETVEVVGKKFSFVIIYGSLPSLLVMSTSVDVFIRRNLHKCYHNRRW